MRLMHGSIISSEMKSGFEMPIQFKPGRAVYKCGILSLSQTGPGRAGDHLHYVMPSYGPTYYCTPRHFTIYPRDQGVPPLLDDAVKRTQEANEEVQTSTGGSGVNEDKYWSRAIEARPRRQDPTFPLRQYVPLYGVHR